MLGANLAAAGMTGLFAAEPAPAVDSGNMGQYLPYVVGGVFTLVVVIVGLVLSRKSTPVEQPVEEDAAEGQKPDVYLAPNPLLKLILPGILVVALGVGIIFFVVPLFQDLAKARQNARETVNESIKAKYDDVMKSISSQNPQFPMGPAVQVPPIQYVQPQINMPKITVTPPMPRIPQVYVDSKGIVRTR